MEQYPILRDILEEKERVRKLWENSKKK